MKMKTKLPEPERWCELPTRGATAETTIGAALKQVRDATEPSDAAVARVSRRIDDPPPSTRGRLIWRLAIAAVLIMATGGAVGAALKRWGRVDGGGDPPRGMDSDSARGAVAPGRRARRGPRIVGAVAEAPAGLPPEEVPTPAVAPPVAATPPPSPPVASPSPPVPPVASRSAPALSVASRSAPALSAPPPAGAVKSVGGRASSGPSSEAAVLAGAFRELRANGDPAAALRSLDAYDRRFAAGTLRGEARIARVEALLALDHRPEALALLEQIRGPGSALTRDVRTTRGELLAEIGRCPDARRDFDAVVATRDNDAPGARALYGRASCHLRAGDVRAARQDLDHYLRLHPNGPSAPAARRALESLR